MRRTWIVLIIAVLALTLVASPGLAAGGGGEGSTSFNLIGTISAITCPVETEDGVITVDETWPDTGEVDVVLDPGTLYKLCTGTQGEGEEISCADLANSQKIRIVGNRDGTTLTARRVILLPAE
jgi:hypothetical protein